MSLPTVDTMGATLAAALDEFGAVRVQYADLADDAALFDRHQSVLFVDRTEPDLDAAAACLADAVAESAAERVEMEFWGVARDA